ncbi:hypothetical protein [Stenotrophomonas maltophilia]|uniref:hypothetical protein n=1 Tax=Stenotrophomonas maltophilia TaxID=40324 RepID=UPI001FA74C04|nr:hypothetical protein [Stenotrophomonas maltophilia]
MEEDEVQGEKRSNWSKIDAAWPHQDAKGYRIVRNAMPVNGVVALRLGEHSWNSLDQTALAL